MVRVLRAVQERFGWRPAPAPSGRGVGVAFAAYRGALVAAMAEVALDRATGAVKVRRVVLGTALGLVVNPDGARQQIEGCVTMGLGYALGEEIPFEAGRVKAENFDTYPIPRFSWLPEIETVLVPDGDLPPQGCGEPPITVMGALVANALHDAAGIRLLQLPMTPKRVLQALSAEKP
jgi:CO/xanthine dehydrogenase Mo-binding subunit